MSKKLTDSQRKWLIWEKELAAAVWATAICRPYLIGQSFDLITDNKVIEALLQKDLPTKRQNWVMRLSEFNYNVVHRNGNKNANADFFSRMRTSDDDEGFYDNEIKRHEREFALWTEQDRLDTASKRKHTIQDATLADTSLEEQGNAQIASLGEPVKPAPQNDSAGDPTLEELAKATEAQSWLAQKQQTGWKRTTSRTPKKQVATTWRDPQVS